MTRATKPRDPRQEELALSTLGSLDSRSLFPGRTTLYIREVAAALRCTEPHVINLIETFELTAGAQGLKGFDISCGRSRDAQTGKVPRSCWRVAVSDFDAFLAKPRTSHTL